MRAQVAVVALLVVLAGCGASQGQRLVGKWKPKVEIPAEELSVRGRAMVEAIEEAAAVEFKADGTVVGGAMLAGHNARWSVVRSDGDQLTVKLGPPDQQGEVVITFTGPDQFTITPAEGERLTFVRAKEN